MNTKLVDSLVQIIESLSPEETALLQEKLSAVYPYKHILQLASAFVL
ncbi:MAG: hypothetical protein KME29_14785 [Calothrix sp. FI2-JRJ7]|nr:hypothetical protein [Calothrix sp. FI2-JRJ7]